MVLVHSHTPFKASALRYLASSLSITLCAVGAWSQPVRAEGSRDMFPDGAPGNRGHIIWRSGTAAGFRNRTLLRVYAEEDEYILVGSSAVDRRNGDIEIFNPNRVNGQAANETIPSNPDFTCTDQDGLGFIANRAEELAGPESIDGTGNTGGYEPCFYQAPETGIYYVAMYGPSGRNSTESANNGVQPNINQLNTGNNQNTGISAWDVTVRSSDQSSTDDLEGRLHTFLISLNMGRNGRYLHSDLYPITTDGYRYEIDMRGLDPFGFRIFGSQLGNLDSDGVSPLYKDVLGENGSIDNPEGGTSSAPPQYPIFFNEIDNAVLPFLPVYDPTGTETGVGFPPSPILPVVSSPSFSGNLSGSASTVNTGGNFSFDSNLLGVYQIVISRDGVDFDPSNPQNRVLRGYMPAAGPQTVSWNGQDKTGDPFPVGSFRYEIQTHGGEYHFPLSDAENNVGGGPTYTLLNGTNPLGNNVAFYDHSGYRTLNGTIVEDRDPDDGNPFDDALCGLGPPNPPATDLSLGADSSTSTFNVFGLSGNRGNTNRRCDEASSFGDTKTLDLWTYTPSPAAGNELLILDLVDYGDAPDTEAGNGAGNYSTLANDDGPVHGIDSSLVLGNGVTDDTDGFVDGTDDNGDATDDTDDAFTTLPDVIVGRPYSLSDIPVNNTTGGNATLHAWIDFDQDGQFEASEYQSATVINNASTADLSWTVPSDASAGTTYARFRLTTDSLSDDGDTAEVDERSIGGASDGEVEDYQLEAFLPVPDMLLVKRITAINRGRSEREQLFDDSYVDVAGDPNDNEINWPEGTEPATIGSGTVESYIRGITGVDDTTAISGVTVRPGDEIEYTVSFLSNGDAAANDLLICDRIPENTTFANNAFNNLAPRYTGGGNRGIYLEFNNQQVALTNVNDGDEIPDTSGNDDGIGGYYFAPGVLPSSVFSGIDCGGSGTNENGAIVVDLSDLPNAAGEGTPDNSYGFIRFRVVVD
ncbi:DUF11 domain-containing protein [cf. Phormidesmis sp. LEGE 11477]|uniref:DUF11 domain-containing protein n=1 Tax=cf. Phormidesmis sp. LEGE 11477 TaxID=1828680 RepID=UPI0019F703AA|nr:DUF11 domain-containing protein [cf. Phormidesmis sp. LEGE 11477]MBE9064219.1 DUF11 domain-containing protein [cf. Phormidesmis sp. LEGE 11477]